MRGDELELLVNWYLSLSPWEQAMLPTLCVAFVLTIASIAYGRWLDRNEEPLFGSTDDRPYIKDPEWELRMSPETEAQIRAAMDRASKVHLTSFERKERQRLDAVTSYGRSTDQGRGGNAA